MTEAEKKRALEFYNQRGKLDPDIFEFAIELATAAAAAAMDHQEVLEHVIRAYVCASAAKSIVGE